MTPNSFTVSWSAATGTPVPVYLTQYRVTGVQPWTSNPLGTTALLTQFVGGLTPATAYDVRVQASNVAGVNFSNIANATTPAALTVTRDMIGVAEWGATASESANDSTLNSTSGAITDATGATWTLVTATGLSVRRQGAAAGTTSNVILLLYHNHTIYYEDSGANWFSWNGIAWVATTDPRVVILPPESPNTTLTSTTGSFVDTAGVTWTLVSGTGLQVARNGAVDATTANTVTLLYYNHAAYRQDNTNTWQRWSGSAWAAFPGDPRESPDPTDVTTAGPTINASPTPGVTGSGNLFAITPAATISVNGTVIGGANVTRLYYTAHNIYQFGGGQWWGPMTATVTGAAPVPSPVPVTPTPTPAPTPTPTPGPTPTPTPAPTPTPVPTSTSLFTDDFNALSISDAGGAPSGAAVIVMAGTSGTFTDGQGAVWSISGTNTVLRNGVAAGFTSNVAEIALVNGVVWQENTTPSWYSWDGVNWNAGNDPTSGGATGGWMNHYPFGGSEYTLSANNEAQYYASPSRTPGFNPFSVSASILTITADSVAHTVGNPFGLPYNSGAFTSSCETSGSPTAGLFNRQYGYYACRAKLPAGRGLWPAFWLEPQAGGDGEIDIMEALGHDTTHFYCSVHYSATDNVQIQAFGPAVTNSTRSITVTCSDYSVNFHEYAVDWQADFLTFYLDGVKVGSFTTPAVMQRPYYMLCNLAVGALNSWPGPPDGNTVFPAKMLVDYIKVFDKFGSATAAPAGESADKTLLNSTTGTITDALGVAWKLVTSASVGLQVSRNGVVDATTSQVVFLGYYTHTVYYEGSGGAWFSWTGSAWATAADPRGSVTESPDPTSVTTVGPQINASPTPGSPGSGNIFAITAGGQVSLGGTVPAAYTATGGVTRLYYTGHTAYQFGAGQWYAPMTATSSGIGPVPDPTGTPTPVPTPAPTPTPPGGTGPAVSGSFVNVDFTSLTGKTVVRELFGVSTATMLDFNFQICGTPGFQVASLGLNPPLLRFNSNSGATGGYTSQNMFPNGPRGTPDWTVAAPLVSNLYKIVNLATTKIIMGFGGSSPGNDFLGWSVSDFAFAMAAFASHLRTTNGGNGVPIDPLYWEVSNEPDVSTGTYNSYFNACADAIHAIDSKYIVSGPVMANDFGYVSGLISGSNSTRLGLLDGHFYLYCPGSDPVPTDQDCCQGLPGINPSTGQRQGTSGTTFASQITSNTNGTYMAGKPFFTGEYNIGCGPPDTNNREQTIIGACYAASTLMQLVSTSNVPVWGGIWEYGPAGNWGLFTPNGGEYTAASYNVTPQGYLISKGAAVMPGSVATSSAPTGGINVIATVIGGNMAVMMVNYTTGAKTGQVALSHWPINSTGTAAVHKWELSQANIRGAVTTVNVTAGLTASITVPGQSVVILYP